MRSTEPSHAAAVQWGGGRQGLAQRLVSRLPCLEYQDLVPSSPENAQTCAPKRCFHRVTFGNVWFLQIRFLGFREASARLELVVLNSHIWHLKNDMCERTAWPSQSTVGSKTSREWNMNRSFSPTSERTSKSSSWLMLAPEIWIGRYCRLSRQNETARLCPLECGFVSQALVWLCGGFHPALTWFPYDHQTWE